MSAQKAHINTFISLRQYGSWDKIKQITTFKQLKETEHVNNNYFLGLKLSHACTAERLSPKLNKIKVQSFWSARSCPEMQPVVSWVWKSDLILWQMHEGKGLVFSHPIGPNNHLANHRQATALRNLRIVRYLQGSVNTGLQRQCRSKTC